MNINIKGETIIDKNKIKNTFFEGLINSGNNSMDIESFKALTLINTNDEELEELTDKYLLNKKELIRLATNILLQNSSIKLVISFRNDFDNFINDRIDINLQDNDGNTFLHYLTDKIEYTNYILDIINKKTGNFNIKNSKGFTPLHKLCANKFDKVIDTIIDENIGDFNVLTSFNFTPLYYLCTKIQEKESLKNITLKIINKNIGNFNLPNTYCETPLYKLCEYKHNDLIIEIINKNIGDFTIKNLYDISPYDVADNEIKNLLNTK